MQIHATRRVAQSSPPRVTHSITHSAAAAAAAQPGRSRCASRAPIPGLLFLAGLALLLMSCRLLSPSGASPGGRGSGSPNTSSLYATPSLPPPGAYTPAVYSSPTAGARFEPDLPPLVPVNPSATPQAFATRAPLSTAGAGSPAGAGQTTATVPGDPGAQPTGVPIDTPLPDLSVPLDTPLPYPGAPLDTPQPYPDIPGLQATGSPTAGLATLTPTPTGVLPATGGSPAAGSPTPTPPDAAGTRSRDCDPAIEQCPPPREPRLSCRFVIPYSDLKELPETRYLDKRGLGCDR